MLTCNMFNCNVFTRKMLTRKMLTRNMLTRKVMFRKDLYRRTLSCNFCPAIFALQNPVPQKSSPQCVVLQFLPRKLLIRKYIPRNTLSGESCPVKSCPAKYCPAKLKIWSKLVGTPCNSVVVDSSSNLQFLYFLERKNPQSKEKMHNFEALETLIEFVIWKKKSLISSKKLGWRKSKNSKSVKILVKYSIYRFCIKQLWRILELLNKFYWRKN